MSFKNGLNPPSNQFTDVNGSHVNISICFQQIHTLVSQTRIARYDISHTLIRYDTRSTRLIDNRKVD